MTIDMLSIKLFKYSLRTLFVATAVILFLTPGMLLASDTDGTINAVNRYAWMEAGGWLDLGSSEGAVHITDSAFSGYAWSSNFGWISLNCSNTSSCTTVDYKVANDGEGNLSGYAYGETAGWIDFDPANGGITINSSGIFSGYAWGDQIGWIVFNCATTNSCGTVNYSIETDWRPVSARDSTAPVRSAGSPSGSQSAGTSQVTMSLTTDESATCKYGTTASTAYAYIANTFTTTGGTSHSATISGLSSGNSYNYYIRCNDGSGNANSDDYTISFSVASLGRGRGRVILYNSVTSVVSTSPNIITVTPSVNTDAAVFGTNTTSSINERKVAYNLGAVTLKLGSRGKPVKELQKFLNVKLNLKLVLDGKMGSKTITAVKKYQKNNGLKVDGIVGLKTKEKMKQV